MISGGPAGDAAGADEAAATLNGFEGVELDAEAQAEIYRALEACAERRRALEADPENDPERDYVGRGETNGYAGELEIGVEYDLTEYRPEGEHVWENLGEGGNAAEIDRVVAEVKAARAGKREAELAAEAEAERAAIEAQWQQQNLPAKAEPDPDDPRFDWRNWESGEYVAPGSI